MQLEVAKRRSGKPEKILGVRFLRIFVGESVRFKVVEKQSPAWPCRRKVTGPQVPMFIVGYDTYHSVGVRPAR